MDTGFQVPTTQYWPPPPDSGAPIPGEAGPPRHRWWRRIGVFSLGFVSAFVLLVVIEPLFSSGDPPVVTYGRGGQVPQLGLEPGVCAQGRVGGGKPMIGDLVACSAPHELEVYSIVRPPDVLGDRYDAERLGWLGDELCFYGFEPFVGLDYDSSQFDYMPLIPSDREWRAGTREVTCVLFEYLVESEGSAKGSRK